MLPLQVFEIWFKHRLIVDLFSSPSIVNGLIPLSDLYPALFLMQSFSDMQALEEILG